MWSVSFEFLWILVNSLGAGGIRLNQETEERHFVHSTPFLMEHIRKSVACSHNSVLLPNSSFAALSRDNPPHNHRSAFDKKFLPIHLHISSPPLFSSSSIP
uniref:Secreted protein n=1 Tax=Percolomonas cosmopolitus TaxID=63605 RepID=A0A7S1PFC0_9EUKA|mmetsp:Transcript_3279/g.12498  ORF Transcript_3279/g.12498 Transcript_3279/m.12498 type:complete len:101 (+) Transcript_3279:204-506(+)